MKKKTLPLIFEYCSYMSHVTLRGSNVLNLWHADCTFVPLMYKDSTKCHLNGKYFKTVLLTQLN
jgi:hypothetical protein